MKTLVFISIPMASPGLNTLKRMHFAAQARLKTDWWMSTQCELHKVPAVPKAQEGEKRRVTFTRYSVQPLDPDNFVGGVKMILDNLRRPRQQKNKRTGETVCWAGLQLIYDDDEPHLEAMYFQERVGRRQNEEAKWRCGSGPTAIVASTNRRGVTALT